MTDAQRIAYELMLSRGESPRLAEMLALGAPPMSSTDREFLEGRGGCYDQFNGNQFIGDFYAREAKSHGVDTTGKVYLHGLAAFPGDPKAWVSGRGDVKRVIEERGWSCQGAVNISAESAPPSGGGLASDLVTSMGGVTEESREKIVAEHAPHWAKREI